MLLLCGAVYGGGVRERTMPLAPLFITSLTSHKWIVVLQKLSEMGGFVYVLGPCGPLPQTRLWLWEFLPLPWLMQIFTSRGFESLVSHTETLGSAVCLASQWFFPAYWPMNLGPTGPPAICLAVGPLCLGSLSLPFLPVWMNVSLTLWLLDFHEVWVSGSSGCFLFLNLLLSFWLYKKVKHFYLCLHYVQNSCAAFSKSLAYQYVSRSTWFCFLNSNRLVQRKASNMDRIIHHLQESNIQNIVFIQTSHFLVLQSSDTRWINTFFSPVFIDEAGEVVALDLGIVAILLWWRSRPSFHLV